MTRRASIDSLPSTVAGLNEGSGEEMRALFDALESERAAHARCLHEEKAASGAVGHLEQRVSDSTTRLSVLQGELQAQQVHNRRTSVALTSEHAVEITALEAGRAAAQKELAATEGEVQSLRAALQAARHSETREVEELQLMKVEEAEACRAAKEEVQTLAAEQQTHVAALQSLEQLTCELKEQHKSEAAHVVCDEMQTARALGMCHSRELEAARVAACKAESDCFVAERLELQEELHARMRSHRDKEQVLEAQLQAAAAGHTVLLSEVEAARFECASAEMHVKTEEQSYAVQIEAAALAASTKELEALRSANKATAELHKECRARQLLMDELADLRSLQGQQQAIQRMQAQPRDSWWSEAVMSSWCCARQPSARQPIPVDGDKLTRPESVFDTSSNKSIPELTLHGPGTPK